MTDKEALKLALEALELLIHTEHTLGALDYGDNAITAIKQALAAPVVQKPIEPADGMGLPLSCGKPLCSPGDHYPLCRLATPPAQPERKPLTVQPLYTTSPAQPAPEQEPVALADEVIGCFHAAEIEGLTEALANTTDERLKDLVERRLIYALFAAQETKEKSV